MEDEIDISEVTVNSELEGLGMIIGLLLEIRDELQRGNTASVGDDLGDLP